MTLDKKAIDMLLSLNDAQLLSIVGRLAKDAGIDPSSIVLSSAQISGLRQALSMATDGDIARASELIKSYKAGKKNDKR